MAEERNLPDTIDKVIYHNAPSAQDEPRAQIDELLASVDRLVSEAPRLTDEQPIGGDA
jgi:hypothetical protein